LVVSAVVASPTMKECFQHPACVELVSAMGQSWFEVLARLSSPRSIISGRWQHLLRGFHLLLCHAAGLSESLQAGSWVMAS
jgi:hypothetical protein